MTDYTAGVRQVGSLRFHVLRQEDRELFDRQIRRTPYPVNLWSSNFAYFLAVSGSGRREFLWRLEDGLLIPFVLTRGGALYLQCLPFGAAPPEKVVSVLYRCMHYCLNQNGGDRKRTMLKMAGEGQLAWLRQCQAFDRLFAVRPWQGVEYHLSAEKLARLEGPGFADVRNRVRKFHREHPDAAVRPCVPGDYEDLLALDRRWRETSGRKYAKLIDGGYYRELVARGEELGQTTLGMCEHGHIVGMAAGGLLPTGQSWSSLIKFDAGLPGLSETLLVEFGREMLRRDPRVGTINLGSDLGESGLRRYKMKFHPVLVQKRYRVALR